MSTQKQLAKMERRNPKFKSLRKREVFGLVVQMLKDIKLARYKWVFVRKYNKKNKIIRYKAQLVTQGFL